MDLVLCTLNARFYHSAFGLRYLQANLHDLMPRSEILEFTIKENPSRAVEEILKRSPKIVGLGVYIWNTRQSLEVVRLLKERDPKVKIILGGPEVSYEQSDQELCKLSDLVIEGEGEAKLYQVAKAYFESGEWPSQKIIAREVPELSSIQLPYDLYTDQDVALRTIYVEASRGCPYKCEYCLSSLDTSVRNFDLDRFLLEMKKLMDRGVRGFKFVDRTFNLSPSISTAILDFFLKSRDLPLDLHFEMVPDRLPDAIKERIALFAPGQIQLEIGIQTLNTQVSQIVSRKLEIEKVRDNIRWLRANTQAHLHADLIAGLPSETLESFGRGFDMLYEWGPQEIQLGILKRLRGAPIARHTQNFRIQYQEEAPYTVLQTGAMSESELLKVRAMASFWNRIVNSGKFKAEVSEWASGVSSRGESIFWKFFELSDALFKRFGRDHSISQVDLVNAFIEEAKLTSVLWEQELVTRRVKRQARHLLSAH